MTRLRKAWSAFAITSLILLAGCSGTPSTGTSTTPPGSNPPNGSNPPSNSGFPTGFWDATNIPPAQNVMMIKFLNRTNGQYSDSEVYWKVSINGNAQTHSIADQPLFDMPANSAGRIYFYLGSADSQYSDFIEYTIGATQFNGNTTRVDAFGIKVAILLHCADGYEVMVGENPATFAEDRAATFQRFINAVPVEFQYLAQIQAPYKIVEPGAGEFGAGGQYADYYDNYVDEIWETNELTIPKPGPNASGLAAYPDLSAAIYRHTAAPGSFATDGTLLDTTMWVNSDDFYLQAPADYYAKFWHDNAINGKAYGFPYDDVGGYSSFISHNNPQYLLVAIGW